MKPYKLILSGLFLTTLLLSCEKEGPIGPAGPEGKQGTQGTAGPEGTKGDKGPAGPKGATGAKGATGDKGPKGDKGDKGTANVIYSDWLNPVWNLSNTANYKTMRVTENTLTNDFNENGGTVLTFFRFQDNVVFQMPYTNFSKNNERHGYAVYFPGHGEVRFTVQSTDGTALTQDEIMGTGQGVALQFRYVLIPGGISASAALKNVNLTDYTALMKALDIPD